MRPRVALLSVVLALAVLGAVAENGLEGRLAAILERRLSKRLGVPVKVAGVGFHRFRLEAKDVHLDAEERGMSLAFERVAIGFRRVEIDGGDVVLDEAKLFSAPSLD